MLVEIGNPAPVHTDADDGPCVTYISVPDSYTYEVAESAVELANGVMREIYRGNPMETHLPEQEAIIAVVNAVAAECESVPSWVWADNDDFAVLLGRYYGCPIGRPDDVEQTHRTTAGAPGVLPAVGAVDPTSSEVNS